MKHIGSRIDEQLHIALAGRLSNGRDSPCLPVDWIEPGTLHNPILEIDSNDPELEQTRHIGGQLRIILGVASLEIDC